MNLNHCITSLFSDTLFNIQAKARKKYQDYAVLDDFVIEQIDFKGSLYLVGKTDYFTLLLKI